MDRVHASIAADIGTIADARFGQPNATSIAGVSCIASVGGASTAACPGIAAGMNCIQKRIKELSRVNAKVRGARVDSAATTVDFISESIEAGLARPGTDSAMYLLRLTPQF